MSDRRCRLPSKTALFFFWRNQQNNSNVKSSRSPECILLFVQCFIYTGWLGFDYQYSPHTHPSMNHLSQSLSFSLSLVCVSLHFICSLCFRGCVALSVCLLTLSTCSGFVLSVTSHITKQASCQKTYLALVIQEGWHQLGKTRQDGGSTSIFISSTYK